MVWLSRITRRIINIPMAVGAVAVTTFVLWGFAVVSGLSLDRARLGREIRAAELVGERHAVLAQFVRATMLRQLSDFPVDEAALSEFGASNNDITGAIESENITRSDLVAHSDDAQRRWTALVEAASQRQALGPSFVGVNVSIERLVDSLQFEAATTADMANDRVRWLRSLALATPLLAALLTLVGMQRRIAEYQ